MLLYGLSIFAVINGVGKVLTFCMPCHVPSFVSEFPVIIPLL